MKRPKQGFNIKKLIENINIAALFTGAAILFYACQNNIEEIKTYSITDDMPFAEFVNLYTKKTDSGRISFTLKAPKLLSFKIEGKEFSEFPEGLELKKFDRNGNIVSSIKADYAKQNVLEDTWEAMNNVVATNIQGDTLKTEHLIWEGDNGKIHTNEYVKIISADRIIYGDGLTSDEQMQDWKILKPKGTIFVTVDNTSQQVNNNDTLEAEPIIKQE